MHQVWVQVIVWTFCTVAHAPLLSVVLFFLPQNELHIMHGIICEKPARVMMVTTAAGKSPENKSGRAGKSCAAHYALLKVENESFGSPKHLLCSHECVDRRSYEKHTFMPVTSNLLICLFLLRDPPPLCSCRASKTTPINTYALTHTLSHSALLTISHAYQLVRPNCRSREASSCPG